jgi:hypothetical protein
VRPFSVLIASPFKIFRHKISIDRRNRLILQQKS